MNLCLFVQYILPAIVSGAFSLIVVCVTQKYAEKQMKMQFDYEKEKDREEKKEELQIKDKAYIDEEIIKNLTIALNIMPRVFEEVIQHATIVNNYYTKNKIQNKNEWFQVN